MLGGKPHKSRSWMNPQIDTQLQNGRDDFGLEQSRYLLIAPNGKPAKVLVPNRNSVVLSSRFELLPKGVWCQSGICSV